ncbi:unnamed protein product [Ceratitis capitata]|uniref:(Mediterranean fruit fly) hypothetical protein n=1 Tax=Ceratitis capitata TaxID=7213 RepID=A0A811V501_CERCA|nr:unnamed protein product [Ceratitis capitata]
MNEQMKDFQNSKWSKAQEPNWRCNAWRQKVIETQSRDRRERRNELVYGERDVWTQICFWPLAVGGLAIVSPITNTSWAGMRIRTFHKRNNTIGALRLSCGFELSWRWGSSVVGFSTKW